MYQSAQAVRERGTPVSTGGKGERDTQKLSVAPGNRREILSLTSALHWAHGTVD